MGKEGTWWTSPQESESGRLIMVTGRDKIDKWRTSGKYPYRIDVTWRYDALPDGMPDRITSELMEQVTDALLDTLADDKAAVMTGIYTGDGQRDWVFYTKNLRTFGSVFNRALAQLPTIPIVIEAADDPGWEEYLHMRDVSYIPDGE